MNQREVLAIIPARGGSKRVPRKNLAQFEGKPLLAHSIEDALGAALLGVLLLPSQFGMVRYDHIESGFQLVSFAWGPRDTQHAQDLAALLPLIPEGASLSAGEHEGPHAARRRILLSIKDGPGDADYVLFGLRSLRWGGRDQIIDALERGSYGVVERRGSLALLGRGHSTEANVGVVNWLRRADPDRDW